MKIKILFALLLITTTSCSNFNNYMEARGNDLADCFTIRAGLSYGLGVRVQATNYLSAALGGSFDEKKAGYFGRDYIKIKSGDSSWFGIPFIQVVSPVLGILYAISGDIPVEPYQLAFLLFCTDYKYSRDGMEFLSLLGVNTIAFRRSSEVTLKWEEEKPKTPFIREKFFFEAGFAAGIGIDTGFNPVELVDFLLGWFTVDITGDDSQPAAK
ncbi:MAG: hypothetical protein ABIH42_09230 [Planctomycetota bacterium]